MDIENADPNHCARNTMTVTVTGVTSVGSECDTGLNSITIITNTINIRALGTRDTASLLILIRYV